MRNAGVKSDFVAFDSTLRKNFSFHSVFVNAVFFSLVLAVRWSHEIKTHQQVTPGYVERKGCPILTEGLVSLQGLDRIS